MYGCDFCKREVCQKGNNHTHVTDDYHLEEYSFASVAKMCCLTRNFRGSIDAGFLCRQQIMVCPWSKRGIYRHQQHIHCIHVWICCHYDRTTYIRLILKRYTWICFIFVYHETKSSLDWSVWWLENDLGNIVRSLRYSLPFVWIFAGAAHSVLDIFSRYSYSASTSD